jgi:hypothetical protein
MCRAEGVLGFLQSLQRMFGECFGKGPDRHITNPYLINLHDNLSISLGVRLLLQLKTGGESARIHESYRNYTQTHLTQRKIKNKLSNNQEYDTGS